MSTQNEKAVIDLVINGEAAKASLKQIKAEAVDARKEFNRMVEADDPDAYKKKIAEVRSLESAARSMSDQLKGSISGWKSFAKEAGTIVTGIVGAGIAEWGLQTLVTMIPAAIDKTIKLKDSIADIMKTTNMTEREVQALNKSFKDFNTRTPTEELREMAVVAGQFGIPTDQIKGFVQVADQLNVAMGKDFGGAEQVATEMTMLRNVFQDIKTQDVGQDMLHIGNAINYLESQGAATAPVIAEFSNRIGGVAIPLGLTTPQVLGYSAAMQELNISTERGSTATVDILNGLAKTPALFAKYAVDAKGAAMSTKDFADLVNRDLMQALLAVVKGFNMGDVSATGMAAKMKDMKLEGNGAMEVFMKLATNTDLVNTRIGEAEKTIGNASSVMSEFNKKNYELAVNQKKLSEWFGSLLSRTGIPAFAEWIVNTTTNLLGLNNAMEAANKKFESQRDAVRNLQTETQPLLKRHDELKEKTRLTATEQTELEKIIKQIATTIPQAVTQFDSMGRAMSISSERAREYIKQQKEVLKYTNQVAIQATDAELAQARAEHKGLIERRTSGISTSVNPTTGATSQRALSAEELTKADEAIAAKIKQIAELESRRAGLSGDYLEERESTRRRNERRQREAEENKPRPVGTFVEEETKEEKAAARKKESAKEKAAREEATRLANYERLLEASRARTAQAQDDAFEKEQLQFGTHYAELLKLAGNDADKQLQVRELMYTELAAIEGREEERQAKAAAKKKQEQEKQAEADRKAQDDKDKMYYESALKQAEKQHADKRLEITTDSPQRTENEKALMQQAEIENDKAFYLQKIALQKIFNQDSADTERQLTETFIQEAQRKADADKRIADLKATIMQDTISSLKNMVGEHTTAYKILLTAEKSYALAQVLINTQQEISLINKDPTFNMLGFAGPAAKALYTGLAWAKAVGVMASIGAVAMKDDGGFTDIDSLYGGASGFMRKPTMVNKGAASYMVGEKRPEWIMGGRMLEDPVFANLAVALDAVQKSGDYSKVNQLIGTTPQPVAVTATSQAVDPALVAALLQLNANIQAQGDKQVVLNYRLQEEYAQQLDQVRTETML